MPCEQLVSFVCDIKQAYTQYGGKRPFGVSILYMGWDKELGYQLYQSDPSGIVHTRLYTAAGVRSVLEVLCLFFQ